MAKLFGSQEGTVDEKRYNPSAGETAGAYGEYSGDYGTEFLKEGQKRKLERWKGTGKEWKAAKKEQKWLEKQAPNYDFLKSQYGDQVALDMFDRYRNMQADMLAGKGVKSDAEMRQELDRIRTAAMQEEAAKAEALEQGMLSQGQNAAMSAALKAMQMKNRGGEVSAKAARDVEVLSDAADAQRAQQFNALGSALTSAYGGQEGQNTGMTPGQQALLGFAQGAGAGGALMMEDLIEKSSGA
jgi:hypothetical protein